MKALILAAGRGSRAAEETENKPKCLIEINGKTLLSMLCENFERIDITDINIVTGYLNDKIHDDRILKKYHNKKWRETNMLASMLQAKDLFDVDDVLVTYSDIFFNSSLLLKMLKDQSSYDILISYDVNFLSLWGKRFKNPLEDLETFRIDSSGYVEEIGGKPTSLEEIQGQYMGLLIFNKNSWPKIFKFISSLDFQKLSMTELLSILIKNKFSIKAVPNNENWGEIDSVNDKNLYLMPPFSV